MLNLSAQTYDVILGPVAHHFTDSTQDFWFLIEKNEKPGVDFEHLLQSKKSEWGTFQYNKKELVADYFSVKLRVDKGRKLDDEFSFLLGSCVFQYPFPFLGNWKKKNEIFNTMRHDSSSFMIWLGDNVYYLFGQWNSRERMIRENIKMRKREPIHHFLASKVHYATWDDHDFGPNNSDGNFSNKKSSEEVFKDFWILAQDNQEKQSGVYQKFSHGNCDFFILDSRYFADENKSILYGDEQINWLKKSLLASKADFKFICSGSQFFTNDSYGESWFKCSQEYEDFMLFIQENSINGIICLSGDRHYSELNRMKRKNAYAIPEFTCSPLTSFINPGYPKQNNIRVENTLVVEQNYGKIRVYGRGEKRCCELSCYNSKGVQLWQEKILFLELQ